uniref:Uncharacterized protein n=1 Tax=Sphaerodactylus townsendi TaxID=933632 RepID=A0ACB8GA41_9SAUR
MQQLLKGQETRFTEGIRIMKHRLTTLQNAVTKAAPELQTDVFYQIIKQACTCYLEYSIDEQERLASDRCRRNTQGISACTSHPCQNGATCVDGVDQYKCICPQEWTGTNCQYQTQTGPPEWSVTNDPAFSRKPRCAKFDRMQHCSCEAGFHMSGTAENSICQDVNECEVYKSEGAPRLCMHTCINIPGSYHCSCPSGYKVFSDGKSCEGDTLLCNC